MIKVKLSEIVGNVENLKAIQEVKFPAKISYRLMRLVNKIQPILDVYNKKREDLIKELGSENEDKTFSVKGDKLAEFQTKLAEIFSIEEELEWELIKIEDLGDIKLEAKLLISWLFE